MNLIVLRKAMAILLLLSACLHSSAHAGSTKHVLIINSYHQGMDWTDGETAGVIGSLANSGVPVEFFIEYMDAKRLTESADFEIFRQLLSYKYRFLSPDAIVVTDNDAFDFMRRHRDTVFPGVPVVFCGVNWFQDEQLVGHSDFTGVAETADSTATLEFMLRTHPGTERIVIVIDDTTTGRALRRELEPVLARFAGRVGFEFWDRRTPDELSQDLATLGAKTLVLLMPYARDRTGVFITYEDIAKLVSARSPVPVYANWDFYLGYGIVGGVLTTANAQGVAAAGMLQRILGGESARNLPVQYDVPRSYAFDYRQLARFGISTSLLPDGSRIVHQPWRETNRHLIWMGGLLALVVIALLWGLLVSVVRKRQADQALRESMDILLSHDSALREISQGVLIAGADRRINYANSASERMSGYSADELRGISCSILQGAETSAETKEQIRNALDAAQPFHGEILNYRKDGTPFWNALSISPVFDAQGRVNQFVGIQYDVTQRKQADVELRIAAKAFESQVAMLVADADGIILRVNQAFTQTTGYSADEAIGKKTSLLKSGRHDKAFYAQFWQTLKEQKSWQGVIWNRRKSGSVYAEWLTINAVLAPDGLITHYVCAFSDITQNKEAEAEVHRLAYYDQLTQFPNRRLLQDRLGQALVSAQRSGIHGAVLFLDLDNFSTFNDTRGHEAGDQLLTQVALRLRQTLRNVDTVARPGGDEFVAILEELGEEAEGAAARARHLGQQLCGAIAHPYELNGQRYTSTVSVGICLFHGGETVEQLLKNAEIAMYQAKASGRNTVRFFDPEMQASLDRHSALENDLRQALAHKELLLYYQPQVDRSGRILGAEILLRWKHPLRGFISPVDFIPLAEETGLILPIGQWVMEGACNQVKQWSSDPVASQLKVSVNVSSLQFRQDDFVERVSLLIRESGIDATRLKLELTETLVLGDIENTIMKMLALRQTGVSFSMDDFGTGYSSLAYLTRLPLDEIKIDKSFVSSLPGNHNDEIIAQTIISMGQSLGLRVVAEGVETEEQRVFLEAHGCHAYQGYLFSRPVPLEEFSAQLWSGVQ